MFNVSNIQIFLFTDGLNIHVSPKFHITAMV